MTRAAALERVLGTARRRGFEDGRTGKPSLVERAAAPRDLVTGLATIAGGGLLKTGEAEAWSSTVAAAYSRSYRQGASDRARGVRA